MNIKKDIDELVAAKLSGRISEEASKALNQWVTESEENKKEYNYLSRFWNEKSSTNRIINSEELEQSIWDLGKNRFHQPVLKKNQNIWKKVMRLAAVFIGVLLVSFIAMHYTNNAGQDQPIIAVQSIIKTTQRGQKTQLRLPDGTSVVLNTNSSIEFPEVFPNDGRIVKLTGEAYFDVQRDESRPFTVISKGVRTKVLGTSFDVRSYPDEPETKVGVIEGRVQVYNSEHSDVLFNHTLIPNQMSVINLDEKMVTTQNFESTELVAWKDWVLNFEDESLESIFKELENWYAVDIVIADHMDLGKSYSGSFENETLKSVLEALSYSAGFDFQLSGNKVTINNQ